MKTYTSVINVSWAGNKHEGESKQDYIDKVIEQFYDDFGIEIGPNEITNIEEIL